MDGVEHPTVLVQDYHFALLPRLIKETRPDARVAIFWHIPWPNPEAFGICPWQRELLEGLLGADLIGFHIQSHCNNFLETIDRALESRIEWERYAVNRGGHITSVRPFPISVDFKEPAAPTVTRYAASAGTFRADANSWAWRRTIWASAWTAWTTPRAFPSASAASSGSSKNIPPIKAGSPSSRSARPAARTSNATSDLIEEVEARGRTHQSPLCVQALEADRVSEAPPRPSRDRAVLSRFRSVPGHFLARWHESGGQRVCRQPRRTKRRPDPQPLHRAPAANFRTL